MQLKPGTILQGGKYRIIKVLGQGGFGITYEAEQALIDRRVCIKEFFLKSFCDRNESTSQVTFGSSSNAEMMDLYKAKFIKEAKTIAKLNHPGIIKIYDVFTENNTAYYVMEFIDGQSLNEIVNTNGPLPQEKAIEYIKQVSNALRYAHSQHVMHLDVKPSNVMLDGDRVVLIDFGLAKQYSDSGEQTSTTPVGISHGYAPLEQYQEGGVKEFSPATDVYSIGATLFKLVSGQAPPSATEVAQGGIPTLPSSVSPPIRVAIEKAMNTRKQDRPQNINTFLSILCNAYIATDISDDEEETIVVDEHQKTLMAKGSPNLNPKPKQLSWLVLCVGLVLLMLIIVWRFVNQGELNKIGTVDEQKPMIVVHAPDVVSLSDRFKVVFEIIGDKPTAFQWNPSDSLTLVWGPQKEANDSSVTFTYVVFANQVGDVTIRPAVISIMGKEYYSDPMVVSVLEQEKKDFPKIGELGNDSQVSSNTVIKARDIRLVPYNINNKETYHADGVNYFVTTLTLNENKNAKTGNLWVYVLANDANGKLLKNSASRNFQVRGKELLSSACREVYYEGEDLELSIYLRDIGTIVPGKYTVDVYTDESHLGSAEVSILSSTYGNKENAIQSSGIKMGHEYVDLGLSVKWASCNVGATSPGEYGNYYAWSETSTKEDYSWSNVKYCVDTTMSGDFNKYNPRTDNKKQLDKIDDAACVNWGGQWRMPTYDEWTELRTNCTWTWASFGGANGYKVTSKINGRSIFLPAAGERRRRDLHDAGQFGRYWTSSRTSESCLVYSITFNKEKVSHLVHRARMSGFSVRPVLE